ncbi:hypothetical protein FB451DRAFT_1565484 [Mycena latifolia]|nr:hypothetical protein FB451DRAFT_1565484 [Mycena latifolia]
MSSDMVDYVESLRDPPPAMRCALCSESAGHFRCIDCPLSAEARCGACIKSNHRMASCMISEPLHQIQRWNGIYWERADLGLCVQLGHRGQCPAARDESNLSVITRNGVQPLSVIYCGCHGAPSRSTQLINAGLLPAGHEPQWAVTFQMAAEFADLKFGRVV